MATSEAKDYEVLYRIRLGDGTLVRPASEETPGTNEVKTVSLAEEEARPFLDTGAVRPVPTRRQASVSDDEEPSSTAPVSPAPPAPTVESQALAEVFDADLASTLEAGGFTTVEQVRGASDEELNALDGIGKKSVDKVRKALA
jgi:hypothetical protein